MLSQCMKYHFPAKREDFLLFTLKRARIIISISLKPPVTATSKQLKHTATD